MQLNLRKLFSRFHFNVSSSLPKTSFEDTDISISVIFTQNVLITIPVRATYVFITFRRCFIRCVSRSLCGFIVFQGSDWFILGKKFHWSSPVYIFVGPSTILFRFLCYPERSRIPECRFNSNL